VEWAGSGASDDEDEVIVVEGDAEAREGGEGGRPATRRGRARGDGGFPPGTLEAALADAEAGGNGAGRGLHSSTSQLNLIRFVNETTPPIPQKALTLS